MGRAIKVREQGTEEVNQAVASGEISLNMAEKIVNLNPAAEARARAQQGVRTDLPLNSAESLQAPIETNVEIAKAAGVGKDTVRKEAAAFERIAASDGSGESCEP